MTITGKKSLHEIFQLYFMMKDRIFSKSRLGFGFNTEALEEILQDYLDPDIKMTDVTHPKYVTLVLFFVPLSLPHTVCTSPSQCFSFLFVHRVLISAVNKATTNLELHFFNNCFGDEYMDCESLHTANLLHSRHNSIMNT